MAVVVSLTLGTLRRVALRTRSRSTRSQPVAALLQPVRADNASQRAAAPRVSSPRARRDAACAAAAPSQSVASSGLLPWVHLGVSLSAFGMADQALMKLAAHYSLSLPPPLLGMFCILVALAATEAVLGTPAVDRVAAAVAPAVDWIGRWLPLFYVSSLVTLPLALRTLSSALLAKVGVLLSAGFVASLVFAAVTTVAIRRLTSVELLPTPPNKYAGGFTRLHTNGWALLAAASLAAIVAAPGHLTSTCVQAFMLSSTVFGFLVGSSAPSGVKNVFHPLITCAAAANGAAYVAGALSGVGWESVLRAFLTKGKAGAPWGAGDLLMAFLHSVILSFGFRVFAQRALMRRHWAEVGATVVASSAFSMLSTCAIGAAMALPTGLCLALAPRCVTVALALPISAMLGAGSDASLTAAAVVFTGLLGANFAQSLLTAFGFTDPVVRGLATAASAHGLGTAALAGKEPEALPMAALAYATMGVISTVLVTLPQFRSVLVTVAGG